VHKALLIDPDVQSRKKTEHMLNWKRLGFAVEAYAGHFAGVAELLEREHFSLLLLDIKQSPCQSLQLCRQIRRKSQVPIILIGGSRDFELAKQAMNCQVNDYLPDPVQASELTASLKAVKRQLVLQSGTEPLTTVDGGRKPRPKESIIDAVKKYVDKELHRNITLKKISEDLHFSCAYLGQKFKHHENMSYNEYVLKQRMEKAKRLLEQTDLLIYEVANMVGYTEIDWFYKKFKAYTGTSAKAYRKIKRLHVVKSG